MNGFGWVRYGRRGTAGHKSKTRRDINGCSGHVLGPYGRGNFPGHHVLQTIKKTCTEHSGWVLWVSMGADGYMDTEGGKNKTNGGTNG